MMLNFVGDHINYHSNHLMSMLVLAGQVGVQLVLAGWLAGLPVKEDIKTPLKPACQPAMTRLEDQLNRTNQLVCT